MIPIAAIAESFLPGQIGGEIGSIVENIAENMYRSATAPIEGTFKNLMGRIQKPFSRLFLKKCRYSYFRPRPLCCHFVRPIPWNPVAAIGDTLKQISKSDKEVRCSEIEGDIAFIRAVIPSLMAEVELLFKSEKIEDQLEAHELKAKVAMLLELLCALYLQQSSTRAMAISILR